MGGITNLGDENNQHGDSEASTLCHIHGVCQRKHRQANEGRSNKRKWSFAMLMDDET